MTDDLPSSSDPRCLAEAQISCPWGVLLVTDDESTDAIPSWASDEDQVTNSSTALVTRVVHQDDGEVLVRVWDGGGTFGGGLAFVGILQIDSGRLRVSDALGQQPVVVEVRPGPHGVQVFANSSVEASSIDLVIDPIGAG